MIDDLGDRIKNNFEDRTRYMLPRRTYTLLRLDGKAFHTYTKGLNRPFDDHLSEDIDNAIIAMMPQVQGAVFAYTQSDEISILLTDFASIKTDAWFDGNIQKITSVAASILTAEFNKRRYARYIWDNCDDGITMVTGTGISDDEFNFINNCPQAYFDCRSFSIPDRTEVMNYFIFRNNDCARNSVSMVAQYNFSHRELHGKSTSDMHEMLHQKGINWATDFTAGHKNGRIIHKEKYAIAGTTEVGRTRWVANGAWKFTENKEKLLAMIPKYE